MSSSASSGASAGAAPNALMENSLFALIEMNKEQLDNVQTQFLGLNHVIHPMLHLVTLCHGLNTAMRIRKLNPNARSLPLVQCFIAFLVGSIGGGTTTGVLLGVPPKTFGTMDISTLISCWVLMFLFPMDIVGHFLSLAYPVRVVVKTLATVSSIYCIFSGVDAALSFGEAEYPLAVLCGTIAATWGGVLSDLFNLHSENWHFATPDVLRHPTRRLLLPFLCSCLYASTQVPTADKIVLAYSKNLELPWSYLKRYIFMIVAVVLFFNALPSIVSFDRTKATPASRTARASTAAKKKKK